ncbi:MAG: guanylate kinase [Patescibacteria group bacterium]|nr:guanylate kinase [Patescibacteria group bacterium]
MQQGKLILIVGPSGSGKGTLVAFLREQYPELVFPISCTTRVPRPGEENGSGKKYHHLSKEAFAQDIAEGKFLEWAQYGENYYGTPKAEVMDALAAGKNILHELEMQGAEQLRAKVPHEQLVIIFIDAGPWEELKRRIIERGHMQDEELQKREARYIKEITFKQEADFIIDNRNGKLDEAKARLKEIVNSVLIR